MFRSILLTFGVRIISAALNFLVLVLLSNELGADGKGVCSKFIAIIANALIFCDLIGGPALVYLAAKMRIRQMLLPSYLFSFVSSFIVLLVFMLLRQLECDGLSVFMIFVLLSFFNSAIAIHQNILMGKMAYGKLNILIFIQAVLTYAGIKIMLSANKPTFYGFVWGLMIAYVATALLGFIFMFTLKNEGEKVSFSKFFSSAFKFGFTNQVGHLLQFCNGRLSYFILGNNSVGVFSNATSIGESVWMVSNSIITVQYGKVANEENEKKASAISLVLLKLNLFIVFCGALFVVFLPDNFFQWLFGPEFTGIHSVLVCLFPGLVFYSGYLVLGHHFSGRGEFVKNIYAISFGFVVTISSLIIVSLCCVHYSLIVASIITSISYFFNFFSALILFTKTTKFKLIDFLPSKSDLTFIKQEFKKKK